MGINKIEDVVLLANPELPSWEFAKKIQNFIQVSYSTEIPLYHLEEKIFPNGEPDLEVPENIRQKDVFLIHDSTLEPFRWLGEIIFTRDLLFSASAATVSLVLPDMLYSRKDWKDRPHVPISARAVASAISPGLRRIITMELHSASIQGFYPATMPLDNLPSYPPVIDYIRENVREFGPIEELVNVTPDSGGTKRVRKFASKSGSKYPIAIVDKVRNPITGDTQSMNLIGDVRGKNCLVIDDMISSGGTLEEALRLLKDSGAKKVYCSAPHGLFTKGYADLCSIFDKVIVSNTHYRKDVFPFKTIDVSPIFAKAIYNAQVGGSISGLF